jgi:hypothetical protein
MSAKKPLATSLLAYHPSAGCVETVIATRRTLAALLERRPELQRWTRSTTGLPGGVVLLMNPAVQVIQPA